ncbi:MAG TPA: DUF6049 family protein [Pseudonocardia sp.]|nr:DUF6049 family protein [Pseudonocardia sp.]
MKRFAALVATAVLILSGLLLTGSPARAVPVARADDALLLDLAGLDPRIVTADGPPLLTLTGTLRNTGTETVDDLQVRVQRGPALGTAREVRAALAGDARADGATPDFTVLPGELAPGEERSVRIAVPLRGAPRTSLALTAPGVYELLVNVNGAPEGGPLARLAAVRMLLPVLSLPAGAGELPVRPDLPPAATPVSVLYPLADEPRRLPTVPGEPTLLTDDTLAASFAPDGRLGGLVAALAQRAPVGDPLREAVCLAVDPTLVETADAMRQGYEVLAPDGTRAPGTGAQAAARWLDELTVVASGGCLIALPYADADLVALTRGGLADLARQAVTDGRSVLARILRTPVLPGVTWPADGVVDEATVVAVTAPTGRSLVLGADGLAAEGSAPVGGLRSVAAGGRAQLVMITDPMLTDAAAAPPVEPSDTAGARTVVAAATAGPLSTQDLIGALAFRGLTGPTAGAPSLALAPPHRWSVGTAGAVALLDGLDHLVAAGLITPREPGPALATGPVTDPRDRLEYPDTAGGREIPAEVLAVTRATLADVDDLASATDPDAAVGNDPADVLAPLRQAALRGASAAWRGSPAQARAAATAVRERVGALRATVRVVEPPGPYSLGSSEAPLLLTVTNGLPVTMQVRVQLTSPSGLQIAPIGTVEVPPLGRRQVEVTARITRSGQFTVLATARTPAGGILGPPSRLLVRSTAYGDLTVWFTAVAGALLVVLAVRRVLRRVRGGPDPDGTGRPDGVAPPDGAGPPGTTAVPAGPVRGTPAGPGPRDRADPPRSPDPGRSGGQGMPPRGVGSADGPTEPGLPARRTR